MKCMRTEQTVYIRVNRSGIRMRLSTDLLLAANFRLKIAETNFSLVGWSSVHPWTTLRTCQLRLAASKFIRNIDKPQDSQSQLQQLKTKHSKNQQKKKQKTKSKYNKSVSQNNLCGPLYKMIMCGSLCLGQRYGLPFFTQLNTTGRTKDFN